MTLWPGTYEEAGRLRLIVEVWKALDKVNPEAILIPGYSLAPVLAAALWGWLYRRRTILMSDSTVLDQDRFRWKEKLKGILIRSLYDAAIVSGKRAAGYVEQLGLQHKQIGSYYDVVDNKYFASGLKRERNNSSRTSSFLFVGRLIPCKNLTTLVQAFEIYRDHGGTWELLIAGTGPLGGELELRARLSRHRAHIHFRGHQRYDVLPGLYAGADCLVLPSVSESWGLVVNEAMASSLPVIVSNRCGCVEDLVEDGRNGFVVDPLSVDELSDAMLRMSGLTQGEREVMGRRSAEIIQEFSLENWAAEVERIACGP